MSSDFQSTKLEALITFANGRTSPDRFDDGAFPVYGSNGLIGLANEVNSPAKSIVIGRVGSYCGSVHFSSTACWVTDNAIRATVKGENDPSFLYYLLKHLDLNNWRSGSGQPLLNQTTLNSIEVSVPPPSDQRLIGSFVASLDDRITLLRETNSTLEAIAQALFTSWFVDFDPVRAKAEGLEPEGMDAATAALFPDSFEESELGLVPSGWRMATLAECCERVESGGTPKRTVPEYWGGNVPWLTSGEVRNPIVLDTKEKISDLGVRNSSAKLWPKGTTVVAMYGATAGEVCLLAESSTANQACCALIPKSHSRVFIFMCVRREREALASKSSGSAQQNLNKGLVSNHPVLLAHIGVLNAYEDLVGSMLDGWIENERQSQTLTQLRDTLLPRLISGQLRLPEAEVIVEEVCA